MNSSRSSLAANAEKLLKQAVSFFKRKLQGEDDEVHMDLAMQSILELTNSVYSKQIRSHKAYLHSICVSARRKFLEEKARTTPTLAASSGDVEYNNTAKPFVSVSEFSISISTGNPESKLASRRFMQTMELCIFRLCLHSSPG